MKEDWLSPRMLSNVRTLNRVHSRQYTEDNNRGIDESHLQNQGDAASAITRSICRVFGDLADHLRQKMARQGYRMTSGEMHVNLALMYRVLP